MSVAPSLSIWWRDRKLASDHRAGAFPRAKARRAQLEFLHRNARHLLIFAALIVSPGVVAASIVPSPFVRGLIVGGAVVGAVAGVHFLAVQLTGTAPLMMGDEGERWTAAELRRLRRHGWRVVNHAHLWKGADVDHLVVGPGGLFAVQTKWSATPWTLDVSDPRLAAALVKAHEEARRLRLWAPVREAGTPVTSVIVVWGRARPEEVESPIVLDGVTVVRGVHLRRWFAALVAAGTDPELSPAIRQRLWDEVVRQVTTRDDYESRRV